MRSVKDAIAYGLQKAQYKDVREHQRKVIEGYCSGKWASLALPKQRKFSAPLATIRFDYQCHGQASSWEKAKNLNWIPFLFSVQIK